MNKLSCPSCGKSLSVRAGQAGQRVRCPHCQAGFRLGATSAPATPTAAADDPTQPPEAGPGPGAAELTEFLAPAQGPGEMGRLGPYRVLAVLGSGGMGVVYRAEHPQLQRPVALKAMLPTLGASTSARARFLREARAAAALRHDHVVGIYQVGEDRGVPFLAMEFLDGQSLEDRLRDQGRLPTAEVVRIGREVAEGLAAAHEKGLIHRDIKPANVWLEGKRDRVKILDFGLARAAAGDGAKLTQTGAILGTPAYMAPEQARGEEVDGRADLFSLGCVLYRMIGGRPAFTGKDPISTLVAVATEDPPLLADLAPRVPPALARLVTRLLAKSPAERPASAQEVAEELEELEKAPPTVQAPTLVTPVKQRREAGARPRRAPARRSWVPFALMAAAVLLVGGGIFAVAQIIIRIKVKDGEETKIVAPKGSEVTVEKGGKVIARVGPGPAAPPTTFFNGKDLTGWEGLPEYWSVKDGALVGSAPAGLKFNTFLCSKKKYRDFELSFQVRLKGDKANSGVQVRSNLLERTRFTVQGPQADMGDGYWGALYGERFGGMMKEAPPEAEKAVKAAEFNDYFIRCVGKHVTIKVNGVTSVDDDFARMPDEGIIGWQLHAGPALKVTFRNIVFKDLSADVWVPLFNGKDLGGWEVFPRGTAGWRVEEGVLVGSGRPSHLFSPRGDYKDFHLRAEVMINDRGNSGVYFRSQFGPDFPRGWEAQIAINGDPRVKTGSLYPDARQPDLRGVTDLIVARAPHGADEWFTLEVIAVGNHITIKVNGKTTVDWHDPRNRYTRGHFALQQNNPDTVVKFRKIEVKEIK
jgi:hypothetical protein